MTEPYGLPEERNPNTVVTERTGDASDKGTKTGGASLGTAFLTSGVDNKEYVWSATYIDAMILRDRDLDRDNNHTDNDERLYAQHDANYNVTALVGKQGSVWQVRERFVYDPYGASAVKEDNWDNRPGTLYDWRRRFQGLRYDGTGGGMYQVRFRDLNIGTSRWNQQDPLGYVDGASLYEFVGSDPVGALDPYGLEIHWLTVRLRVKGGEGFTPEEVDALKKTWPKEDGKLKQEPRTTPPTTQDLDVLTKVRVFGKLKYLRLTIFKGSKLILAPDATGTELDLVGAETPDDNSVKPPKEEESRPA